MTEITLSRYGFSSTYQEWSDSKAKGITIWIWYKLERFCKKPNISEEVILSVWQLLGAKGSDQPFNQHRWCKHLRNHYPLLSELWQSHGIFVAALTRSAKRRKEIQSLVEGAYRDKYTLYNPINSLIKLKNLPKWWKERTLPWLFCSRFCSEVQWRKPSMQHTPKVPANLQAEKFQNVILELVSLQDWHPRPRHSLYPPYSLNIATAEFFSLLENEIIANLLLS